MIKTSIAFLALLCLPAFAQSNSVYNATTYAYTTQVTAGNSATGSSSIMASPTAFANGMPFLPFNTNAAITINRNASTAETITPSTVATCYPNSLTCTLSGTFTYKHISGESIQSGTFGLQEALNVAVTAGSGTVVIDATWQGPSGNSLIVAAKGNGNVMIQDNRNPSGATFYQWNGSVYVSTGGGAGSGTVNSATAAQVGRYPSSTATIGGAPALYSIDPASSISSQISGLPTSTVLIPEGTPQQPFTPGSLQFDDQRHFMNFTPLSSRGISCDTRIVNVTLSASSTTATSSGAFQATDVGKTISAAGTFGGTQFVFLPTITAYTNSSTVTLSTAAPFSQTADPDPVGTLSTTAFQNALNYIGASSTGVLPGGCTILTETLAWNSAQSFLGQSVLGSVIYGVGAEDILQAPDAANQGGVSAPGVHLGDVQFALDSRVDASLPYTKVTANGTTTTPTPVYRPGMTNSPVANNPLGPGWAVGATNGVASITQNSAVICVPTALGRMPVVSQQIIFRDTPTIFKSTISSLTGSGCTTGFSPATMAAALPNTSGYTILQTEWVSTSSVQTLATAVTAGSMTYPVTMTFANAVAPVPGFESNFATHGRFKLGTEEYVYYGKSDTANTVNVISGPATTTGWAIGTAVAPENPCYTDYETPWPVIPTINSGDSTPSGANYFAGVCGGNAAISFPQANGNTFVGTGLSSGYLSDITVESFDPDNAITHGLNSTIGIYEAGNNASYGTRYVGINIEGTVFGFFGGPASYGMHGVAAVGPTAAGNHFQDFTCRAAYCWIAQDMQQSFLDRADTYSTLINPVDLTSIGYTTCMAWGYTLDEQTGAQVTITAQDSISNWNCEPEGGSHVEHPVFTYSDGVSMTFLQDTFEGPWNIFGGGPQTVEEGFLANPVIDYGTQNNFKRTSLTLNSPVSNTWGTCTFCEWGTYSQVGAYFANGGGTIFNGAIGSRQSYDGDSSDTFLTGNFTKPYGNLLASYFSPDEWNTNGSFDSAPMSVGKTLDSTELYAGAYVTCNITSTAFCLPAHFGGFNGIVYIGPHDRVRPLPYDVTLNLETPAGSTALFVSVWAQNPGGTACSGFTQIKTVSITTTSTWSTFHIPVDFSPYTGCNFAVEFGPSASSTTGLRIGAVQLVPTPGWVLGPVATPTEGAACPVAGAYLGSDASYMYVCSGASAGAGTVKRVGIS